MLPETPGTVEWGCRVVGVYCALIKGKQTVLYKHPFAPVTQKHRRCDRRWILSNMQNWAGQDSMPMVNNARQPGAVVVTMPDHPPDYVVWSIASIFYGNPCCLGLIAFYYSIKARDRKMMGDLPGAKSYGDKACCVNGFAVALIVVLFIVCIVVLVNAANTMATVLQGSYSNRKNY